MPPIASEPYTADQERADNDDNDDDEADGPTELDSLPPDVLDLIGTKIAGVTRDVTLSCKDAAACSMAGGRGAISVIASATWKRCAQIAETIPTVSEYRRSWGAKNVHAQILKREMLPLARTCSRIRASSTLAEMHAELRQPAAVGRWCPIKRPAALFLLEISLTFMEHSPVPPALRDKDLSACPLHRRNGVYGSRLVRLRDALTAPTLDVENRVLARIAANEKLDRKFREAGFARGWREHDVELRKRLRGVDEWVDRTKPHPHFSWLARALATQNRLDGVDELTRIDDAYKFVGIRPDVSLGLGELYAHSHAPSKLLTNARGEIYDVLQQRHLGAICFKMDPEITMPTLAREEILDTTDNLVLHNVLRHTALTCPTRTAEGFSARLALTDALLESTTLEEADAALSHFASVT